MFNNEEFNFIDIGSVGGLPSPWNNSADNIDFLLNFEPNDEAKIEKKQMTYNTAVWKEDLTLPFYIYKGFNNTGSSLFEQNFEYVDQNWQALKQRGDIRLAETWHDRSSLVETKTLKCRAIDNILKDEFSDKKFHFLKIDAQGAEYNILQGAEKFLQTDCVGLHLELFVIPLYKNIKLLGEVKEYLETFGFELVKKFPTHGTFNSQHDCLFIHKDRSPKIKKVIENVYENAEKKEDSHTINLEFSKKINALYSYINSLKQSKAKVAIYGNGLVGQLIADELQEQVSVIFDKSNTTQSNNFIIEHPSKIDNYEFDKLVISVLGREKEIINTLDIDNNKIYTINLLVPAKSLVYIDKECAEFKEKNVLGPFTQESQVSFDETQVLDLCFNDQRNGLMIDVGAHHGSAARPFLKKDWTVYGYEPDPNNRKVVTEKLSEYATFHLSDYAVSDTEGKVLDFYASKESTGVSSLSSFTDKHEKVCQVTTTTLTQEVLKYQMKHLDFLKIDTEGHDLMVLEGFPWEKLEPSVVECEFEDFKSKPLGYSSNDIADFLHNKGYTVFISEWYPIVQYGTRHTWKRLYLYNKQLIDSQSWGNLLAFKNPPTEEELVRNIKDYANIEI